MSSSLPGISALDIRRGSPSLSRSLPVALSLSFVGHSGGEQGQNEKDNLSSLSVGKSMRADYVFVPRRTPNKRPATRPPPRVHLHPKINAKETDSWSLTFIIKKYCPAHSTQSKNQNLLPLVHTTQHTSSFSLVSKKHRAKAKAKAKSKSKRERQRAHSDLGNKKEKEITLANATPLPPPVTTRRHKHGAL